MAMKKEVLRNVRQRKNRTVAIPQKLKFIMKIKDAGKGLRMDFGYGPLPATLVLGAIERRKEGQDNRLCRGVREDRGEWQEPQVLLS